MFQNRATHSKSYPHEVSLACLKAGTTAAVQTTTGASITSGASIDEINAIRKHCSAIKGDQLTRTTAPAAVVTLAISDVLGDDPSVIGSGPTVPETTTFADAIDSAIGVSHAQMFDDRCSQSLLLSMTKPGPMTAIETEQQETDTTAYIPPAIDSPRGKLVYLALSVREGGTIDDLQRLTQLSKLSLYSILQTLEQAGLVETDGDEYRVLET